MWSHLGLSFFIGLSANKAVIRDKNYSKWCSVSKLWMQWFGRWQKQKTMPGWRQICLTSPVTRTDNHRVRINIYGTRKCTPFLQIKQLNMYKIKPIIRVHQVGTTTPYAYLHTIFGVHAKVIKMISSALLKD